MTNQNERSPRHIEDPSRRDRPGTPDSPDSDGNIERDKDRDRDRGTNVTGNRDKTNDQQAPTG